MSDYTDNDGNPISQRFFTDPEYPKRIFDATIDSYDQSMELEVVGWWPEGDASRYAERIAAMLNEFEGLRRDAERYQWLRNHYGLGNLHTADHTLICLYRVSYSGAAQGLDRCIDAAIAAEREGDHD